MIYIYILCGGMVCVLVLWTHDIYILYGGMVCVLVLWTHDIYCFSCNISRIYHVAMLSLM